MTAPEVELDVRGLPPPEPLEQILAQLGCMEPGRRLRALISREPLPLYPLLAERGYDWHVVDLEEGRCELLIWAAGDAVT